MEMRRRWKGGRWLGGRSGSWMGPIGPWVTVGTVAAYAAMALARPAQAQSEAPGRGKQAPVVAGREAERESGPGLGATGDAGQRRFNIPEGPLDAAVAAYRRSTGLKVTLAVPATMLDGFRSPGVAGLYSDRQALALLLTGTGLTVTPDAGAGIGTSGAVTIAIRADDNVTVTGENAPVQLSLDRYPAPLVDTPQSISVISKQTIHEQGATTLRDTLRNAPGISLAAGEGGAQGDNLTLRGFTARNDIFLDGMRDFGSYYRDPFNYESVEVLEGPSSVEFGRGSTGGVINQESKAPELQPFVVTEGDLGTDWTRRFTADINEPLPTLGPGAAVRLNVVAHGSNVAERDVTVNRRFGVAPELALGLGTANRLWVSYFHFNEDDVPDYGIPWYFNKAAPVARHNYYGFRDGNYLRTNVNMGTLKAEHDVSGWATVRNKLRYANNERDARITEPQVNTASSGAIAPATPVEQVLVNRNQIAVYSNESFLWDQLEATVHARMLGIKHTAVIGAEGGRETSDPRRPSFHYVDAASGATLNTVPLANLLRPDEDLAFAGTSAPSSDVHASSTSYGIYLLDTMEMGRHWELTGGARFDRFNTDEKSIAYPLPVQAGGVVTQGAGAITYPTRLDRKPSWRGALVYKPTATGSVYFGYGTSWNPSAETLALTVGPGGTGTAGAGTANLAPEFNRSYEAGTKWDFRQTRLSVRGDVFRTTKDNARESSPTNSLLYVLAGTQRVDGAEIAVTGRVTAEWQVLSSYTYLHSEVVNSQFYPQSVGYKLANVPDNLFNLWMTYQPVSRWIVGLGGNFVDSRTASSTVPLDATTGLVKQVPSYWVLNAMGSYKVGEHVALQANVFNLADRSYIDQVHPAHLVPGAGISGLVGIDLKW